MATWRAKAAAGWPRVRDHRSRRPTLKARDMAWSRSWRTNGSDTLIGNFGCATFGRMTRLAHLRDFMRRKDNLRFILVNYYVLFLISPILPRTIPASSRSS